MAPDLVPTTLVMNHVDKITLDLLPDEELSRMSGLSLFELIEPTMDRKAAVKLLGEAVVDKQQPELAEHIQAMRGIRDARLHGYTFDLKTMRKYRRALVKHHGTVQLERALA